MRKGCGSKLATQAPGSGRATLRCLHSQHAKRALTRNRAPCDYYACTNTHKDIYWKRSGLYAAVAVG